MQGPLPTESDGSGGTVGGAEVKREKVDVLEIEYFHSTQGQTAGAAQNAPFGPDAQNKLALPNVLGRLLPLLNEALLDVSAGGGVSMAAASRRGAWFLPSAAPPAFERGMNDETPLIEERTRNTSWP